MPICYGRLLARKRAGGESSRSAAVIASNDDLLTELLLRLPAKSLLKFKCVCKHWLSRISDPHFARRKHLKSNAVSALYLNCGWPVDDDEEPDYGIVALDPSETREALEHLDFAGYPRRLTIEQSCNGLLLLREDGSFREDKYLVYNPTTKQSKRLPPVPALLPFGDRNKMWVWWRRLAFDPSQSHSYKVVCIVSGICHSDDYYIGIYSSEIGSWRVCGDPFTQPFLPYETGVYCNGAIHWASKSEDFSLYFDLNEELVWEMPMPPPLDDCHDGRRYLRESGGRLYLVDYYEDYTTHLDVYEMEIDRSGWFIRFEAHLDTLPGITMPIADGCYIFSKYVLYVARGKKEEDSFMVLHLSDADKVIKYNFLSQSHQEICRMEFAMDVLPPAYEYIESLCLV